MKRRYEEKRIELKSIYLLTMNHSNSMKAGCRQHLALHKEGVDIKQLDKRIVLSTQAPEQNFRLCARKQGGHLHTIFGILLLNILSSNLAAGFILPTYEKSYKHNSMQNKLKSTTFVHHKSRQSITWIPPTSSSLKATLESGTSSGSLPTPSQPYEMISKFKSYASNIRRTRNSMKSIKVKHQSKKERELKLSPDPASKSAIRSLLYTLKNEARAWIEGIEYDENSQKEIFQQNSVSELRDALNHALIQAIRASSDHKDYNMILKIVDAAVAYAEVFATSTRGEAVPGLRNGVPLLEARIFGEAISELSRTKASDSKLKKLWKLFIGFSADDESGILASKPSAFELNAMILALGKRGRVRAALDIYTNYTDGRETKNGEIQIEPDAYTASALLSVLADSIASKAEPISNVKKTTDTRISPCWQWNEVNTVLDYFESKMALNNRVYAAALKVNEEAMDLYRYPGNQHLGAKAAMSILERMQRKKVSPDVVTCSAVMSVFDKSKQWRAALALLRAMEKDTDSEDEVNFSNDIWELPSPNEYTYASVISSCARSGRYHEAIDLLDQIRGVNITTESEYLVEMSREEMEVNSIVPNSWIYNSALAACSIHSSSRGIAKITSRFDTAIQILQRMEEDANRGFDTMPDIVSYNTVIAAIGGLNNEEKDSRNNVDMFSQPSIDEITDGTSEEMVISFIDKMIQKQIKRDPVTYRNAIMACRSNPEAALRTLERAFADKDIFENHDKQWNSADAIRLYLINGALLVCADNGEMQLIAKLFWRMKDVGIKSNSRSMLSLIKGLSSSGNSEDSMTILNAMKGDGAANSKSVEMYGIDIIGSGVGIDTPMIEEQHYSSAIMGCLRDGQLFPALKILNAMKLHDLKPNPTSLHGIIVGYCKVATDEATLEFRNARKIYSKNKGRGPLFKADNSVSRTRSSAALAMMKTLREVPVKLQCVVASACAATGMWKEARDILWSLHIAAKLEKKRELSSVESISIEQGSAIAELPKLHRSLLKLCARSGNVTAALWYVDTIQDLNSKLDENNFITTTLESRAMNMTDPTTVLNTWDSNITSTSLPQHGIAMTGEDWKLLMIASSKSSHWKVCLGTLPFLQPFVEATNPRFARGRSDTGPSMNSLNREYENLSRALTAAILAFETRSQYAWAVRAIDDWILWSGRRPAKGAVFSACRTLASRSKENEVVMLVAKVLAIPNRMRRKPSSITYETSYEMAVYTEAITALYNRGLYESADELYVKGTSKGFLPWPIIGEANEDDNVDKQLKLDLHGMNKAIAHSAVRVSLQQHLIQSSNIELVERDVLIITGRGISSQHYLRPVLRPEVQRMLIEEFYPPLSTSSAPKNMGVLKVSANDVNTWIDHQQQQKGMRFLAVAETLKTITSGSRLNTLLKNKIQTPSSPDDSTAAKGIDQVIDKDL